MPKTLATTKLYEQLCGQAHVWFCQPAEIRDATKLSSYKAMLSAQELKQYHRFRAEKDKHRYLVSHALLRNTLSKYLAKAENQWQFVVGKHGKPELEASVAPAICFNLTHTEGLSACVVTLNMRCGIDAENSNRKNKLSAVAKRMFAKEELAQLSDENIDSSFYYYWTLREAYLKALGTGLAASSKEFYFELNAQNSSAVIHYKKDSRDNNVGWQFQHCETTAKHVLAVAIEANERVKIVLRETTP